jgi:hypothetical protein
MKKIIALVLTLIFVIAIGGGLAGCYGIHGFDSIKGSQNLETREFTYANFDRVEIEAPFDVEIAKSSTYMVSVTANDNLFDYIEVTKSGDTLRLRLKPFISFRNTTFQATITMPELSSLEISAASSCDVAGFQTTGDVDINVSGASRLNIMSLQASSVTMEISGASRVTGFVKTEAADFEASGASYIELNGSAEGANMEASGASSLRLRNFYILHASVNLSAASNGDIEVNGNLDVEVSGVSSLTFGGNPTLGRVEVSGASSLNRR